MITIAFAGEYKVLKQVVDKYTGTKGMLQVAYRTTHSSDAIKILISRDPYEAQPNPYQWTKNAAQIFVCVDANDLDFTTHLLNEIREGHFDKDVITLVGDADQLDRNILEKFQQFASDYHYPMIYCSAKNNAAYYTKDNDTTFEAFDTIFDKAALIAAKPVAKDKPQHEPEPQQAPEPEQPKRREQFKRWFKS